LTTQTFNTLASILSLGLRPDLQGPRTRGSLTDKGIDTLDPETPAVEFMPQAGAISVARYFHVKAPDLGGRLGAVSLKSLPADLLPLLRARFVENHGTELFLDRDASEADLPAVDFLTVILGPVNDAGDLGIWTWFPGEPTGATPAEGSTADDPQNLVAVKLHNG